jgi:3'-phosphoadenosine 5'-phosphosulfate sulfotransferase (PAPS reductase)/FAD synthetase
MGIRFEESAKRAKKPRISKLPSTSIFHYKPIFAWNEYHIWNYIEKYNLPYPDLYDQGFHRIGCVICPFIQYKQKMIHKEMYPGMFRAFEKAVHTHFVNKNKGEYAGETFEEWLDYWYHKNFFKSNKGNLNESETQGSIQSGKENQTSRTKLRILTS